MQSLREGESLATLQDYVLKMEEERGFSDRSVLQQCLLLGEEVGELFKAVRKNDGMRVDPESRIGSVDEELADVFIYLCAIANRMGVDIDTALRAKEARNESRTWR